MDHSTQYGSLATRLAGLQQMIGGGLAPYASLTPAAARLANGYASSNPALGLAARAPLLIGASKSQPVETLEAAIKLGLRDFGENKVQEAQTKWPALKARYPALRLHLIGPLQSNKAREAVELFEVIHTVDREKIADALATACEKTGNHPQFLIQVNTGEEPQKAGVAPREAAGLLAHCRSIGLPIMGLMCVPPENENPAPHFALLKKMAEEFGLPHLSMGMSGDFETAIRLGSTMVRLGTALFGPRQG